jgi:hypothetical protein
MDMMAVEFGIRIASARLISWNYFATVCEPRTPRIQLQPQNGTGIEQKTVQVNFFFLGPFEKNMSKKN